MRFLLFFVAIHSQYFIGDINGTQIPITIEQNGYKGVTIAISNKIAEDVVLIDKIKLWMTEASRVLYKATNYRLYFNDVKIILPKSWTVKENYNKIAGSKFNRAHVRIDEEHSVVGKVPYVFGQTECGKSGLFMHLTTYLLYAGRFAGFGEIGAVFVHEWGHLRWGLFDEYASYEEATLDSPSSFYPEDGTWKPVRCTEDVTGRNVNIFTGKSCKLTEDGVPEKDCVFLVDTDAKATASLMGHQNIKQMEAFCDVDDLDTDPSLRHNTHAPNKQNKRCNYMSAWEVMRRHHDFIGNSPGSPERDTTPQFTIEIETDQHICLLLDKSGSMGRNNRISKMLAVTSNFLLNTVTDGTYVGIATFNSTGHIAHPMLQITAQSDREELVASLPTTIGGSTSIGGGLLSCISAFNSSTSELEGSIIYLVTDGTEVYPPYLAAVKPTILASGIILNTLALGEQSDTQLGEISRASGGNSFFYSEQANSTGLIDAFTTSITEGGTDDQYIQIDSLSFVVLSGQNFEQSFVIDDTIGRETLLQVVTDDRKALDIKVTGPDQTVYGVTYSSQGLYVIRIPNIAETGTYKVSVSTTSMDDSPSVLNIQSKPRIQNEAVIRTFSWLSDNTHVYGPESSTIVYVAVLKGMAPILNADVFITIERDGNFKTTKLHDNGIGSDMSEDDGIYSGYLLSSMFNGDGRYTLKAAVENLDNGASMLVSTTKSDSFPYYSGLTTQPIGIFKRIALPSELQVTNYSSDNLPDHIKPSRITTLKLESVRSIGDKIQVILTWKAVGDDFDIGTASTYEVKVVDNFSDILQQSNLLSGVIPNIPVPKSAGSQEQLSITLAENFNTKYIAVRAVDDVGNRGDYSYVVSVSKLTDTSWTYDILSSSLTLMGTFISGAVAFIVLISIIIVFVLVYRFSKNNSHSNKKESNFPTLHRRYTDYKTRMYHHQRKMNMV